MAPSTHSNSKAMFCVADQKRVICFTHDSGLKKIVSPILSDRFRMHSFTDFEANCDLRGDLHGDFSPDPIKGLRSCSVQLKDWLICMNSRLYTETSNHDTFFSMMILIQNNQALVWLKKGIRDNNHFVTALLLQQVTNSHFPFFMILSRDYRKKRLCISGVRRTHHDRNHIDVNIFGIVTYMIIAGLRTLKRMKRFFWKGSNYFKADQTENNNRKAKATKKQENICLKHRNHNQ
ncbi:hypothetical protein YC2023_039878 [Brassica napus]